ncbi:hypothetical protein NGRA_1387 [Nosema granulosis]|uniref:Uncharacterized protein n=1 Tax=Nosema granulosis TaxID=83296 RepID=A0A9P6GZJ3_9MICR|nr:hypothetical protein NGRA_1387 [Nosema granulosis]
MVLIIDTYEIPARDIAMALFKRSEVTIEPVSLENLTDGSFEDSDKIYYIHKETIFNLRTIKYYFNEIIEVDSFVVHLNKKRKTLKYYRIIKTTNKLKLEEIKQSRKLTSFDKTSFLPYLKAQEDEIVIFPEDDDE